jgi:hypothetical protein
MTHLIQLDEKAKIYPQTQRNTSNDTHSSGRRWDRISPKRVDWTSPLATEFNLEDLHLNEISSKPELKTYLQPFIPYESGIYYIYIRNKIKLPPGLRLKKRRRRWIKRKKKGRPMYSRKKLRAIGICNRPRQRLFEGINCILKFEVVNGTITKIFERKGKRKRAPYDKPKYELLQKIEKNKKLMFH